MEHAFTREQADEICEDFVDLIDTELVVREPETKTYLVDHVVPVPFTAAGREFFIEVYNETLDPIAALATYEGNEYDVVIICQNAADSTDVLMMDIRTYIKKNGVGYNFPE